jgi:hypothetical protein
VCVYRLKLKQFKLNFLSSQIKSWNHLGTCCLFFPPEALVLICASNRMFDPLRFGYVPFGFVQCALARRLFFFSLSLSPCYLKRVIGCELCIATWYKHMLPNTLRIDLMRSAGGGIFLCLFKCRQWHVSYTSDLQLCVEFGSINLLLTQPPYVCIFVQFVPMTLNEATNASVIDASW